MGHDTIALRSQTDLAEIFVAPRRRNILKDGSLRDGVVNSIMAVEGIIPARRSYATVVRNNVGGCYESSIGVVPAHAKAIAVHMGVVDKVSTRMEGCISTQLYKRITRSKNNV